MLLSGGTLTCSRYGGLPLFRGTFFLKSSELSVSVFELCAEPWVPFLETCTIMGKIFGKILQNY